jgi:tRNA 2-thiouridine synthesizing protein E
LISTGQRWKPTRKVTSRTSASGLPRRNYYEEYQIAPAVRVLIKAIKKSLGPDKGNSKYLYELFPYGPAKQACKIAGLPKPTGCI